MLGKFPVIRPELDPAALPLTPREEQVVALVADGLTNRGVAGEQGARRELPGGMDAEQRLSAEGGAAGYNGNMRKGEEIAR